MPQPGTDATEGVDLLASAPNVEEEVAEAERILKEPEAPRATAAEINAAETAKEVNADNEDFLSTLLEMQEDATCQAELFNLVSSIEALATKHKEIAAKNGYRSIAGDFNSLLNVSRHIAKRAKANKYWEKVPI